MKCARFCLQTWAALRSLGSCLHPRGLGCAIIDLGCALIAWAHHRAAQSGGLHIAVGCAVWQIIGGGLCEVRQVLPADLGCTVLSWLVPAPLWLWLCPHRLGLRPHSLGSSLGCPMCDGLHSAVICAVQQIIVGGRCKVHQVLPADLGCNTLSWLVPASSWLGLGLCPHRHWLCPRGLGSSLGCPVCGGLHSAVDYAVQQIIGGQALQSVLGCALVDLGCALVARAGRVGTNGNAEGPPTKKIIFQYKGGAQQQLTDKNQI